MEKYTRNYCKLHKIRYRLNSTGQLYLFNPAMRKYVFAAYCINNLTENQVRIAIENHVAIYGK